MKKLFMIFPLVFALLLTVGFTNASAEQPSKKSLKTVVLSQKKEDTNIDSLFYKATHGISDIPLSKLPTATLNIQNITNKTSPFSANSDLLATQDNLTSKIDTTAQVLKTTQNGDTTTQDIAVTSFVTIQPMASGSTSGSKWDPSYSVKTYSTFHYSTMSVSGIDSIKETSVNGGWTISDSSVSLSGRSVHYGCSGIASSTGFGVDQYSTKYPSGNSFSYNTPSTWKYIDKGADFMALGVNTYVTLKRGSSTWSLTFINSY
jgi:hypothetical protein